MSNIRFKFRAWDGKKMKGQGGHIQDLFSIRSDGVSEPNYILMQSTFIDGGNGIIFESDIIEKDRTKLKGVVQWCDAAAAFLIEYSDHTWEYMHELDETVAIDIIGNIYENADMVEKYKLNFNIISMVFGDDSCCPYCGNTEED